MMVMTSIFDAKRTTRRMWTEANLQRVGGGKGRSSRGGKNSKYKGALS